VIYIAVCTISYFPDTYFMSPAGLIPMLIGIVKLPDKNSGEKEDL